MSGQGFADRMLHLALLSSRRLRRLYFTQECERNRRLPDRARAHLFVCGLARAGSTALTRELHRSGEFTATTYAMLPMLLAPSRARLLARLPRRRQAPVERAHADGIEVDADSVEALDGLYWSTFFPPRGRLRQPRVPPREILAGYASFIENLLAVYGGERYLAKMNQGIDRIAALGDYFERAQVLVPFREPRFQAASLLRQQHNFARLGWYDRRYFTWLEHDEFGALHRPFRSADDAPESAGEPTTIDYWLDQWRATYAYLLQLVERNQRYVPVRYETLADDSERLGARLALDIDSSAFVNRNGASGEPGPHRDAALLGVCERIYARLSAHARERCR